MRAATTLPTDEEAFRGFELELKRSKRVGLDVERSWRQGPAQGAHGAERGGPPAEGTGCAVGCSHVQEKEECTVGLASGKEGW